jgi:hypothetical protein
LLQVMFQWLFFLFEGKMGLRHSPDSSSCSQRHFRRVPKIATSDDCWLSQVCLAIRVGQIAFHWTDFIKTDIWGLHENLSRKFKFHYNLTRIFGTLHEALYIRTTISLWILLRMRNVLDKRCRENRNVFYIQRIFSPRNGAVCVKSAKKTKVNHFVSNATVVTHTRHTGTLQVQCLSCLGLPLLARCRRLQYFFSFY